MANDLEPTRLREGYAVASSLASAIAADPATVILAMLDIIEEMRREDELNRTDHDGHCHLFPWSKPFIGPVTKRHREYVMQREDRTIYWKLQSALARAAEARKAAAQPKEADQ